MARETVLKCDWCGKAIEKVVGKVYIATITPGKQLMWMSNYTHSGDLCDDCVEVFSGKLNRRKPRENGNGSKTKKRSGSKRR